MPLLAADLALLRDVGSMLSQFVPVARRVLKSPRQPHDASVDGQQRPQLIHHVGAVAPERMMRPDPMSAAPSLSELTGQSQSLQRCHTPMRVAPLGAQIGAHQGQ